MDGVDMKIQIRDANGEHASLTDLALDRATRLFEEHFGHKPEILPGSLADENKLYFQREYVKLKAGGASDEDAAQQAIRTIPFGRSRADRGYDDIEVTASVPQAVDLGNGLGIHVVPTSISIVARRRT